MKKLVLYLMLLCVVSFIFSCNKEEKLIEKPVIEDTPKKDTTSLLGDKAKPIEVLSGEYFKAHASEVANASKVVSVTKEFFAINGQTDEFKNKKPCRIQPIYAYGIDGVAYYEIWFTEDNKTPQGWILISATDKDYPLVNFSQGVPYSSRLLNESNQHNKVYRFGVSYFTMEQNGAKVAEYGKMPTFIANSAIELEDSGNEDSKNPGKNLRKGAIEAREGVEFIPVTDYESLKQNYAKHYFSSKRSMAAREMHNRILPANGKGANLRTAGYYIYKWVPGVKTYYTQIPAYSGSNAYSCWSGCNNNAWTGIYGWWDANRYKTTLIPTTTTGETSPLYRNTTARRNTIDPVQMYIRSLSGTYCGNDGSGWTLWSNAYKGVSYATAKGYGYNYRYQWCNSAGCNINLASILTEGLGTDYTPVHIGANSHFYIGLGIAQWSDDRYNTWAYCYPGWSENDNDNVWISWRDMNTATRLYIY